MNPFDPNPTPWLAEYDSDEHEWVIYDANGSEILVGSGKFVSETTVKRLVRVMNTHGDSGKV